MDAGAATGEQEANPYVGTPGLSEDNKEWHIEGKVGRTRSSCFQSYQDPHFLRLFDSGAQASPGEELQEVSGQKWGWEPWGG